MNHRIIFNLPLLTVLAILAVSCCHRVAGPVRVKDQETVAVDLWKEVNPSEINLKGKQIPLPSQFKTFRLNTGMMKSLMNRVVSDTTSSSKKYENIGLPYPDGKIMNFKITETESMSPALLARYPQLRTYGGKGIEDPTATAKIDFMPSGFHGYIFTTEGSILIQPFSEGDSLHYLCYNKNYSTEIKQPFEVPADSIKQQK
jgi:hypothetical protein